MKLYQYTGADHAESIRHTGLKLGSIPLGDDVQGYHLLGPAQWLTDDADWQNQGWATNILVDEDRTAVRFVVTIPWSHRQLLWHWPVLARQVLKCSEDWIENFNRAGGSADGARWWVYLGHVPPGWLRGFEVKPVRVESERSDP